MLPKGYSVLVTRPLEQGHALNKLITEAGGVAVSVPLIEIEKFGPDHSGPRKIIQLSGLDWLVFISKTAADCAHQLWGSGRALPENLKIAAIGKGTASKLESLGYRVHLQPQSHSNTEALLENEQLMEVTGQHIGIVRGMGGRELLGDVLRQRGALIEYFELYRRTQAALEPEFLLSLWHKNGIGAVVITSGESLQRLIALMSPSAIKLIRETPLIVIGNRIAGLARDKGFRQVVAAGASDNELFNAVISVAESQTKTLQIRG